MRKNFLLALGSQSAVKQAAVQQALAEVGREATVIAVKACSHVAEQPFDEETMQGARNRAEHTAALVPHADLCMAIESGLFRRHGSFLDIAIVLARFPNGRMISVESEGVAFPEEAVVEVLHRGTDTTTIGKILVEQGLAVQHDDPHVSLVGTSRSTFIREAAVRLLRILLAEVAA